ncbi:MAG TPA: biotin transporter BioY, partial [Tetragenococcus sp.]|nr:biotin transporter BioY [Tetragenococcus sp.]
MKLSLREQLTAAIFAGIISIFSQIIIPLGIVPLSLQTFIV